MFFDEVVLELEGGKGGNGFISFHREKYVSDGFPDGGDGGNGGSIYIESDENYNTLQHFAGKKYFKGDSGVDGHKNNRAGPNAGDLCLRVPVGTVITNESNGELIADFNKNSLKCLIVKGGRGGYGNAHFASSVRQAPRIAEFGDIGEHLLIKLELKLVADIGIIGFPSAGKSTLISHLSDSKPKIAAYPFTTLVPNLGVVNLNKFGGSKSQSFVIADIPGIIEGASEGKGLGHKFLRHISRTASLIFLLDPFAYDGKTIDEQYEILHDELSKFDKDLVKKSFLIAVNKIDAIPDEDRINIKKGFIDTHKSLKTKFRMISAASGENLSNFVFELWDLIQKNNKKSQKPLDYDSFVEYKPSFNIDDKSYSVEKMYDIDLNNFHKSITSLIIPAAVLNRRKLFGVEGFRIQQIVRMTNLDLDDAVNRVYDVMSKMGIYNELKRKGAKNGDIIKIDPHFFEFHE